MRQAIEEISFGQCHTSTGSIFSKKRHLFLFLFDMCNEPGWCSCGDCPRVGVVDSVATKGLRDGTDLAEQRRYGIEGAVVKMVEWKWQYFFEEPTSISIARSWRPRIISACEEFSTDFFRPVLRRINGNSGAFFRMTVVIYDRELKLHLCRVRRPCSNDLGNCRRVKQVVRVEVDYDLAASQGKTSIAGGRHPLVLLKFGSNLIAKTRNNFA